MNCSVGDSGPVVTNMVGEEMCCCEVKTVTVEHDGEESEEEYIYLWQEKYACEHDSMQIIEATGTMNFFERCVSRSYCPGR